MLGFKKIAETEGWDIETVWNRYESGFTGVVPGNTSINIAGDKSSLLMVSLGFLEKNTTVIIADDNGNVYGKFPSRGIWVNGLSAFFYVPEDATLSVTGNGAWIDEISRVKFNKINIVHGYEEYSFPPATGITYNAPSPAGYKYIIVTMAGFCAGVTEMLDDNDNAIYVLRSDSNNPASSYIVTALPEISKYTIKNTCTISSNEILELIAYVR